MRVNVVAVFVVSVFLISFDGFAANNSGLYNDLSACSKISEDKLRLACFDQLLVTKVVLLKAVKKSKQPQPTIKKIDLIEDQKVHAFSKQHLKKTQKERGPDSITATISKLKSLLRGQWVIYLENGQQWQQKDSKKIKLRVGDNVNLKKFSMGSVYLSKAGSQRSIQVKRLK